MCSVPASEEYPGWKAGYSIGLCTKCGKAEESFLEPPIGYNAAVYDDEAGSEQIDLTIQRDNSFTVHCASHEFHEYRKFWNPKENHNLIVEIVHDPCAIALRTKTRHNGTYNRSWAHTERNFAFL